MEMLDQITPLILTYNEAPNIGRTLAQLSWAKDVVVVDSLSDDETLEIISRHKQARVIRREFEGFSDQCNYGLEHAEINTEWVLNLDADYLLTEQFVEELRNLEPNPSIDGYSARFIYCINGHRLRSGVYPSVTVLFRKAKAKYRSDGHAHRVAIDGQVAHLRSPILHDDRKPLSRWFQSQIRYTALESRKLLNSAAGDLSWTDRIRRWRIVAPPAMLLYCLIVRGGILDGWAGFYYALQRALAELMLSLYLIDHDLSKSERPSPQSHGDTAQPQSATDEHG